MTTAIRQELPAAVWTVDPIHSTIGFEVKHFGISTFRGRFTGYEGTIETGDGSLERVAKSMSGRGLHELALAPDLLREEGPLLGVEPVRVLGAVVEEAKRDPAERNRRQPLHQEQPLPAVELEEAVELEQPA